MRYFWWAEFQRRGAIHYHLMFVDVPWSNEGEARRWLQAHWTGASGEKLADITPFVQIRSAKWFREKGADYVMKDARKGHRKAYEQEYSRMPRGWRTFRCNQLVFEAAEHLEHEQKNFVQITTEVDDLTGAPELAIYVQSIHHHVPQYGGCRLSRRKQRRKPPTTTLPSGYRGVDDARTGLSVAAGGRNSYHRQAPSSPPVEVTAGWYPAGEPKQMKDTGTNQNAAAATAALCNDTTSHQLPASSGVSSG